MIKTFQALDKDGDGTLSRQEILDGFTALGSSSAQEQIVANIIQGIDNNNSGQIDFSGIYYYYIIISLLYYFRVLSCNN